MIIGVADISIVLCGLYSLLVRYVKNNLNMILASDLSDNLYIDYNVDKFAEV